MNEDLRLIEKYREGEIEAFDQLVRKYTQPLFRFIFRLVPDRSEAEDIVQETFVKAWKNIDRFDTGQKFKTWIYTIAKRTAFDHLRKKKSTPFSFFEKEAGGSTFSEIADEEIIEKMLDQQDAANKLSGAIIKLSSAHRLVLELHYQEDLSLQEIAEISGESYNTVKSRHLRALSQLKKILSDNNAPIIQNRS